MKKTVSIRVSPEVWKEAKRMAVECDIKIGEFVESAILHEVQRTQK